MLKFRYCELKVQDITCFAFEHWTWRSLNRFLLWHLSINFNQNFRFCFVYIFIYFLPSSLPSIWIFGLGEGAIIDLWIYDFFININNKNLCIVFEMNQVIKTSEANSKCKYCPQKVLKPVFGIARWQVTNNARWMINT